MSKVAVFGATGQLGRELVKLLTLQGHSVTLAPRSIDFAKTDDWFSIRTFITSRAPDLVFNCAAENRVDLAEEKPNIAISVNGISVYHLAIACEKVGAAFVHISSDYVFDGESRSPYGEFDIPNPVNYYGRSKLIGETFVRTLSRRGTVIRTAGLYTLGGSTGKGGSFPDKIIAKAKTGERIVVVSDQVSTPTYARDLAVALVKNVNRFQDSDGLFHLTNDGECSWYDFACEVVRCAKLDVEVHSCSSFSLKQIARRPKYSVLAHHYIHPLRPWQEAIAEYCRLDKLNESC